MKVTDQHISIILPCYNERENVFELVKAINGELGTYSHEIIVVDDNSPDGTYQALIDENLDFVLPIVRKTDKGFAKSIRCGIENAKGDIIIIMDSDFNHQPKYLPFMIDNIAYYDCVSASRFQYGGAMDSRSRHYFSWIFNIFIRLMTGGMVTDSLYGYFAIKRKELLSVNFEDVYYGYGDYCIRLFFYLQKRNVSILQFPAINGKRLAGKGNSSFFKVFKLYLKAVLKLTFKERF